MTREVTGYAIVKGVDGESEAEVVEVHRNQDVATNNAYYEFRSDLRERLLDEPSDPMDTRLYAFPDEQNKGMWVEVQKTTMWLVERGE